MAEGSQDAELDLGGQSPTTTPTQAQELDIYDFSKETQKTIGNVTMMHNNELCFTHFIIHDPNDLGEEKPRVEFFISDEAKKFGLKFSIINQLVEYEIARIHADPFGDTSVDPELKSTGWEAKQRAVSRTINTLSSKVQTLIPEPVVVKTAKAPNVQLPDSEPQANTRHYHEDLIEQYQQMRGLNRLAEEKLTPEQRMVLRFAKVYGVLRIEDMEYLFMEHVPGNRTPESYLGFIADQMEPDKWVPVDGNESLPKSFPNLKIVINPRDGRPYFNLVNFRDILREALGVEGLDIAGRNVLQDQNGGETKYVIIDQNPPRINR